MPIKTYSAKTDGNMMLSSNFCVKEFACHDSSDKVLIDTALVDILQSIRNHFGRAVIINSAFRTPAYNRRVGGVANSEHTKGTAADIVVSDVQPAMVAQYAEYIMPDDGGIGLYNNFVHIDVRRNRSRWTNYGTEQITTSFPGYEPATHIIESVNDIVWELAHRNIISNKPLWLKKLNCNANAYTLAYNAANTTVNSERGKGLVTINDIVWELHHNGLISDKHLWINLLQNDENLYWLAYKICNNTNACQEVMQHRTYTS